MNQPAETFLADGYRPFPTETLPNAIRAFVTEGAAALGCDPAMIALPALTTAAGLIGRSRSLRLKGTWFVPSILWTAVIAESGTLKTPAFRLATDYLTELQKKADREYAKKLEELSNAEDESSKPVRRTVCVNDTTIEALVELHDENPRGILVAVDELAAWFGSFVRYKGKHGGSDLPQWLSMHSSARISVHRKTGERRRLFVPHAAVSITGTIQPGIWARTLTTENQDSGLIARFLIAMPPRRRKFWTEAEVSDDVEGRYQKLLDQLLDLRMTPRGDPVVISPAPEAIGIWAQWYNKWDERQLEAPTEMRSKLAKLEEAAARLALVHHCCEHLSTPAKLQPESLDAGIVLAEWFANEARRVSAALNREAQKTPQTELATNIANRGGAISVRELQRASGSKFPTADDARAALDELVQAGLGSWDERTPQSGGRPTRQFKLEGEAREWSS